MTDQRTPRQLARDRDPRLAALHDPHDRQAIARLDQVLDRLEADGDITDLSIDLAVIRDDLLASLAHLSAFTSSSGPERDWLDLAQQHALAHDPAAIPTALIGIGYELRRLADAR